MTECRAQHKSLSYAGHSFTLCYVQHDSVIECRAQHDAVRNDVVSDVTRQMHSLCDRRRVTCFIERVHDAGAVQCSPALVEALTAAVQESEEVSKPLVNHAGCTCIQ